MVKLDPQDLWEKQAPQDQLDPLAQVLREETLVLLAILDLADQLAQQELEVFLVHPDCREKWACRVLPDFQVALVLKDHLVQGVTLESVV